MDIEAGKKLLNTIKSYNLYSDMIRFNWFQYREVSSVTSLLTEIVLLEINDLDLKYPGRKFLCRCCL